MARVPESTTNLYLNVSLANPATATGMKAASILQDLDEDFLSNAADFDTAFVRLSIPMSAVPYFNFVANTMFVTLTWRGVDYKQAVAVSDYGTGTQSAAIFWVNQIVQGVNIALQTAYAAVVAANPTDYQLWPGARHAPFVMFNQTTQLLSFCYETGVWDNIFGDNPGATAVYFNTPLMNLFQNIPNKWIAYNSVSGKDNQLILLPEISIPQSLVSAQPLSAPVYVDSQTTAGPQAYLSQFFAGVLSSALVVGTSYSSLAVAAGTKVNIPIHTFIIGGQANVAVYCSANTPAGSTSIPTNTFTCISAISANTNLLAQYPFVSVIPDEAPSVLNWITFTRIIVRSQGGFPAREEITPTSASGPSGEIKGEQILTDYIINPADKLNGNNVMLMIPQPQYRMIDLKEEGKLRRLDMQFSYANGDGSQEYPLLLEPSQTASAKLLFYRKTIDHTHLSTEERLKNCGGGAGAIEAFDRRKRLKLGLR